MDISTTCVICVYTARWRLQLHKQILWWSEAFTWIPAFWVAGLREEVCSSNPRPSSTMQRSAGIILQWCARDHQTVGHCSYITVWETCHVCIRILSKSCFSRDIRSTNTMEAIRSNVGDQYAYVDYHRCVIPCNSRNSVFAWQCKCECWGTWFMICNT